MEFLIHLYFVRDLDTDYDELFDLFFSKKKGLARLGQVDTLYIRVT